MSVITISRGSYSHGKEIAEKVARRLGYHCISRDILIEASHEFNIPEIKLSDAIHDAPSILNRIFFNKEKYIAYIQAAVLKSLKKDNVVYHGFAGHFFVKDIPHVLKVRIVADMDERIRIMRERNRVSEHEAKQFILKLDRQRNRWSQNLYGIDTSDPSLYDLVIHIHTITVDAAVDIICYKVGADRFQSTPESVRKIEDLCLAAEIRAILMESKPDARVEVENGTVLLRARASMAGRAAFEKETRALIEPLSGVRELQIELLPVSAELTDTSGFRILVVDDEAIVCERLKAFLEGDGHRVETFVNPKQALDRINGEVFDIVISDIRMGAIDGLQVMENVFQSSKHTRVIMITGYSTMQLTREALSKGAFDFIAKPFKMKEIRKTIQRVSESFQQDPQPAPGVKGLSRV